MNKIGSSMIATGCLIFAAATALAQPQGGMMPPNGMMGQGGMAGRGPMGQYHSGEWLFDEMDANHDGTVTKREFDAYHDKWFKELDANHDGKITRAELDAFHRKFGERMRARFKQRFDAADTNHDGALSKDEAKAMPFVARNFDRIDANHDGKVTQQEIEDAHRDMPGPGGMMRRDGSCWDDAASGVPGGMGPRGGMGRPMMQP